MYRSLQASQREIRLLLIERSQPDSTIQCHLKYVSLSRNPQYVALSYCWGDPTITKTIVVNGCNVEVTVNLEAALRELRARSHLELWVDALCINQDELAEKNSQVLEMGTIFSKASQVIAWVGPQTEDSKVALNLIKNLSGALHSYQIRGYFHGTKWDAFEAFFQRPYWKRVWVIQETALAKNLSIWCGERSISWDNIMAIPHQVLNEHFVNFRAIRDSAVRREPISLLQALYRSQDSLATDPRDKVYALLGLTYDGSQIIPTLDYGKPVDEIFMDMTRAMISRSGSLDLITLKQPSSLNCKGSPSWVPDWHCLAYATRPWQARAMLNSKEHNKDWWSSGGSNQWLPPLRDLNAPSELPLVVHMQGNCLQTRGLLFDIVDGFTTSIDLKQEDSSSEDPRNITIQPSCQIVNYQQGMEIEIRKTLGFCKELDNRIPKIPKSLHLGRSSDSYPLLSRLLCRWMTENLNFSIAGRTLREHAAVFAPEKRNDPLIALNQFMENAEGPVKHGMKLFTSEQGYIGMAHPQARKGDKVCFLEACSGPVILRECTQNISEYFPSWARSYLGISSAYRVVGEAYLHAPGIVHRPAGMEILTLI